jgi:adenine-specific DNA methylase
LFYQKVLLSLLHLDDLPYPQDAIMPLPLEEADVVIGDFPIGYYPLDERSREMKLGFEEGHRLKMHNLPLLAH